MISPCPCRMIHGSLQLFRSQLSSCLAVYMDSQTNLNLLSRKGDCTDNCVSINKRSIITTTSHYRQNRISCMKQFGATVDDRKLQLLRVEVQQSLDLVNRPESSELFEVVNLRPSPQPPHHTTPAPWRPSPPSTTSPPAPAPAPALIVCPHKCRDATTDAPRSRESCAVAGVRECHYIPGECGVTARSCCLLCLSSGCCPERFTELYGENTVVFASQTQNSYAVPKK